MPLLSVDIWREVLSFLTNLRHLRFVCRFFRQFIPPELLFSEPPDERKLAKMRATNPVFASLRVVKSLRDLGPLMTVATSLPSLTIVNLYLHDDESPITEQDGQHFVKLQNLQLRCADYCRLDSILPLRCETRWNHESAPHVGARIILY